MQSSTGNHQGWSLIAIGFSSRRLRRQSSRSRLQLDVTKPGPDDSFRTIWYEERSPWLKPWITIAHRATICRWGCAHASPALQPI